MNLPTLISLSRGVLAFFFLSDSVVLRTFAITLAALTDFLDGYLARRLNKITSLGTLIDPLMDKLFVLVALAILWSEEKIFMWQILLFLLRDISLALFSIYLTIKKSYKNWQIRSFFSGKIMTTLQFIALMLLALEYQIPIALWSLLALFGASSFFELIWLFEFKKKKV